MLSSLKDINRIAMTFLAVTGMECEISNFVYHHFFLANLLANFLTCLGQDLTQAVVGDSEQVVSMP